MWTNCTFNSVDSAKVDSGHVVEIFDIGGNKFRLKFLLSENKLNGADLASILKISKSLAYKILDKKRSITPKQMKDLGKYFLVHPGIFL